ncbi:MAG: rhomboid family intramembrane serine protease [Deltaproteobacteria bacterium]|jgi:membrane associated rhomboid family serine protease|nr:rhomboid family intramembrane serine protease [Deltaproteobacteria bacterium]
MEEDLEPEGKPPVRASAPLLAEEPAGSQRIRLARGGAILLERDGFRLIEPRGLKRSRFHPYESIHHIYASRRMLLIGTSSGLLTLRASEFVKTARGPAEARSVLLARLAARPEGPRLMAEVERLDELARRRPPKLAIWTLVALCVLGTLLQLRDPLVQHVGGFVPELFVRGELWRGVTSHLLHAMPAFPVHLGINLLGLLALGHLVERPLGSARTAIVLGLGAVGSTVGVLLYDYPEVLGASGLVAALAGGVLALELNHAEDVPAQWRLPRRLFIGALLAQLVLDQLLSHVLAGGAHLGGFVGGYLAVWLLGVPQPISRIEVGSLRLATAGVLSLLLFGVLGGVPLLRHDSAALERHAARLYSAPPAFHLAIHDNAAAWFLATEGEHTTTGLELAVALADRAVASTQRMNPDFLDTLAEALFQAGDRFGALLTIDEAISLVPHEPYFIEQRRRFTGERDPDDRPPPPGSAQPSEQRGWPARPEPLIDPEAPSVVI